ncbi:MAG TPA: oxygen-dependent coproporphyrinogen oxidase [Actinospica sp.]|nr:oxygen-dependent coproporphyrinogen oxidase [Actinospica sp.]
MVERIASAVDVFCDAQDRLVAAFEAYEGARGFQAAPWQRPGLGSGRVLVLEDGEVFERAGVNTSRVSGSTMPASVVAKAPHLEGAPFTAGGISLILHPRNPYAPSFHANFRFFGVDADTWWFGGVCDMSPSYGFEDDAAHFHRVLRDWCARHRAGDYEAWKQACDAYFTIPHRQEMRGIGGIFFDHLTDPEDGGFERCLALAADGLDSLLPAYLPILDRRAPMPYGERERHWQETRRGRYVEFNLAVDRGTRFGLETGANIEAILVSLPPRARWSFDLRPGPGTAEASLARFLQPRPWTHPAGHDA